MNEDVRETLRRVGRASREARGRAAELAVEGALLLDVAEEVEDLMRKRGLRPAFPTCISIDTVAAHYSPTHDDSLRFRRGNVVKLDLGAHLDGWIADTAVTVEVGTRNWTPLIRASELALQTAIEAVRTGTPRARKSTLAAPSAAVVSPALRTTSASSSPRPNGRRARTATQPAA